VPSLKRFNAFDIGRCGASAKPCARASRPFWTSSGYLQRFEFLAEGAEGLAEPNLSTRLPPNRGPCAIGRECFADDAPTQGAIPDPVQTGARHLLADGQLLLTEPLAHALVQRPRWRELVQVKDLGTKLQASPIRLHQIRGPSIVSTAPWRSACHGAVAISIRECLRLQGRGG